MSQKIVVFGNMPKGDAKLIGAMAERYGFELSASPCRESVNLADGGECPAGVISYLPCNRVALNTIFGDQPPDIGDDVPFFQHLDGDALTTFMGDFPLSGVFGSPMSEAEAVSILLAVNRSRAMLAKRRSLERQLDNRRGRKDRLAAIGMTLCCETEFEALLAHILTVSREVASADSGCVYTRDRMVDNKLCPTLRYRLCQSDSFANGAAARPVINVSPDTLAGCAAYTGQFLAVDDIEKIRPDAPFRDDRSFVCSPGYACKSVLTMPLNNVEDDAVGVLQLMNKKDEKGLKLTSGEDVKKYARPFTTDDIGAIRFLARYAALSIERVSLYSQ
jgi:hypothetical protein